MKKLLKLNLDELAEIMPVLDRREMSKIVGGDIYHLNASGQVVKVDKDSSVNKIVCEGDNSGFILPSTTTVTSGIYGNQGRSGLAISGGNAKLFEYLADNTDVEWGMSSNSSDEKNGKKGTSNAFITTNYDHSTVDIHPVQGYTNYTHNHPEGSGPSWGYDDNVKASYGKNGRQGKKEGLSYNSWSVYKGKDSEGEKYEFF